MGDLFRARTPDECHARTLAGNDIRMLRSLVVRRVEQGLTHADVADVSGMSIRDVREFERLDSDPPLSIVRRYARAVGAVVEHRVAGFGRA